MDGSNATAIITGVDWVRWPNGLAIDESVSPPRLYVTDAFIDHIFYCALDGSGKTKVISQHPMLLHPYAIAVFKVSAAFWFLRNDGLDARENIASA